MSTQEFGKHCWHWLVLATARSAFPQSWCLKILTAYGHGSSACSSAHPPWIRGQVTACTAQLLEFIMHPTLISPTATSRHAASTRRVVIIGAFPKNFRRSACIHSGTTRTAQLCCGNAKAWLPPSSGFKIACKFRSFKYWRDLHVANRQTENRCGTTRTAPVLRADASWTRRSHVKVADSRKTCAARNLDRM